MKFRYQLFGIPVRNFPAFSTSTIGKGQPITPELACPRRSYRGARSSDGGERDKCYARKTRAETRGHWGE